MLGPSRCGVGAPTLWLIKEPVLLKVVRLPLDDQSVVRCALALMLRLQRLGELLEMRKPEP
jgi:hypothetical protein